MTKPEPPTVAQPPAEPAELVVSNLAVGARLGVAATIFAFFCPGFAYFYLSSLNSAGLWRPAGVQPPQGFGVAIMALCAASAAVLLLASARAGRERPWRALAACSFGVGMAAVALQCLEYPSLGFGPMSGGYASVFIAWTALTALFALGTLIWLETLLAYGLRNPDRAVVQPRLAALAFYWASLAGLAVVMWIVLYVV